MTGPAHFGQLLQGVYWPLPEIRGEVHARSGSKKNKARMITIYIEVVKCQHLKPGNPYGSKIIAIKVRAAQRSVFLLGVALFIAPAGAAALSSEFQSSRPACLSGRYVECDVFNPICRLFFSLYEFLFSKIIEMISDSVWFQVCML